MNKYNNSNLVCIFFFYFFLKKPFFSKKLFSFFLFLLLFSLFLFYLLLIEKKIQFFEILVIEVFKNSINDFQNSIQINENLFIEIRFSILFSILDFETNDSQIEILRTQKFKLLSKNSKLNSNFF